MQRVHRVAAATMSSAVITAIMLTGCSTSNSDSNSSTSSSVQTTVIADPAAQVRAAADNTAALSGAHLQLDVAGEVPNLNAKSVVADINTNPYAAKGTATVVFGRVAPREIQAPFVYIENTLYANVDNAGFLGYGDGRSIYDVSVILNKDKGLANVLRNLTNPVKSGTETIDGVETAKNSGQVKASVLAQLTGPRATVPGGDQLVPVTVWLTSGTNQLARLQFPPNPADPRASITINLTKWNTTTDISRPADIHTPTETPSGTPTPGQQTRIPAGN